MLSPPFLKNSYFFPLCLQKSFSFSVRDSLINVGPLKDFSYGLRINADPNAAGIAKQSNYELVRFFFSIPWQISIVFTWTRILKKWNHIFILEFLTYRIIFFRSLGNSPGLLFWSWKERFSVCSSTVSSPRNDYWGLWHFSFS